MKILIFTEGSILMHMNGMGRSREEIVRQVVDNEASVREFRSYIPIGEAPSKIRNWKNQGCALYYLTSRTKADEIEDIRQVLRTHDFPEGSLLFRREGERYSDIVERTAPDILVEDDCESIGGTSEMTITNVDPETRRRITSIAVREFQGINHLPDELEELRSKYNEVT